MKRVLHAMLALCLIVVLLSGMAVPAQAAKTDRNKSLQNTIYYDTQKSEFVEDPVSTGILVTDGSSNYVVTSLPPKGEDRLDTYYTTESDTLNSCEFLNNWNDLLFVYTADPELGEEEGFTPQGTVAEGESVYIPLGWDDDGNKVGGTTTAMAYADGVITLKETPGEMGYAVPVLNSNDQVCGIYYGETCYSLATDEADFYGEDQPSAQAPDEEPEPTSSGATVQKPNNVRKSVALPDLDDMYGEETGRKESSEKRPMLLIVIGAAVVLAAVVIWKVAGKGKKPTVEACEGTRLVDVPATTDSGLRLQMRSGKQIPVRQRLTIGRAPDNNVVTSPEVTSVSGHHCEIQLRGGIVYVQDMGSRNGTFVNGHRIPVGQPVQLPEGAKVGLGSANSVEAFQLIK